MFEALWFLRTNRSSLGWKDCAEGSIKVRDKSKQKRLEKKVKEIADHEDLDTADHKALDSED